MFTQAGYNARARKVGPMAWVHRGSWKRHRPAALVRFAGGDLAWYGGNGRFSWGECRDFTLCCVIDGPSLDDFHPWRAWRCDLETREEKGEAWA
jgi:hypothetical protein